MISGRTSVAICDPPCSIYGQARGSGQHRDAVIVEPGEHSLQGCFASMEFFVLGVGEITTLVSHVEPQAEPGTGGLSFVEVISESRAVVALVPSLDHVERDRAGRLPKLIGQAEGLFHRKSMGRPEKVGSQRTGVLIDPQVLVRMIKRSFHSWSRVDEQIDDPSR